MDDDRSFLTFDEAVARLPDGEDIHTFLNNSGGLMIGADWSRDRVLKFFREHDGTIEESGPTATCMGHGLACLADGRRLFFATKADLPISSRPVA